MSLSFLIIFLFFIFPIKLERENYLSLQSNENVCLVLAYHRVMDFKFLPNSLAEYLLENSGKQTKNFTILKDEFEYQIKYLKEKNAHFVTAEELELFINKKIKLPARSILITFDDVDEGVYYNAFPILKREKIPFTLFIITGYVGSKNFEGVKLCTWSQINEMVSTGLATVGSHTDRLHFINKKGNWILLDMKDIRIFKNDILQSIQTIKNNLGIRPKYFAYPYGYGTPETDQILIESGINLIFSLRYGTVKSEDQRFFIKRVLTTKENWPAIIDWVD